MHSYSSAYMHAFIHTYIHINMSAFIHPSIHTYLQIMHVSLHVHIHGNILFSIVGREDQNTARTIKEAILIRASDPCLNRNIGKFQLPHIWDEVLVKSPELKLK